MVIQEEDKHIATVIDNTEQREAASVAAGPEFERGQLQIHAADAQH